MSSCRKPEMQKGLPEIIKIKWICYFFKQTVVNNPIFKNSEIQKIKG